MSKNKKYVITSELGYSIQEQMDKFKMEVASELGLHNYHIMDRGNLTSRQNGYVGGNMVKKMIAYTEGVINENVVQIINASPTSPLPEHVRIQNEVASQAIYDYVRSLEQRSMERLQQ